MRTWGSIQQRGENRWAIRWPMGYGPDGKRRRGFETFEGTRAEAERRLAELRVEHEGRGGRCKTVDEFWREDYWPDASQVLAPSTLRGYRDMYEKHILPEFGGTPLDGVTGRAVQGWLLGMTYATARHARAVFSAVYARAVAWDEAPANPLDRRYRLPGREAYHPRQSAEVLTLEELAEVAEACQGEPWEAAFLLSAFGGARKAEAFGARTEDMAFIEAGGSLVAAFEVVRGVQAVDGRPVVTRPKTASSRRAVVVPEPWSLRLEELAADAGEWLSPAADGGLPNPSTLSASYRRWFLGKPYKYIPWKNLRNSYATAMHAAGVDLPTVAKMLGHTQEQTTYRHYDRPTVERLGEVAGALAVPQECPTGADGRQHRTTDSDVSA